uniref:Uncharacterized protein n=1 Tax=Cacopsylla melanoneura TaxID=428564 RepID=A0A8D9AR22_9HEMI
MYTHFVDFDIGYYTTAALNYILFAFSCVCFHLFIYIICHNSHSVRCSSQYYCLFLNIEHFHHEGRILSARRGVSHIIMHLKCLRLNCFSNSVWFTSGLSGGGCEFDSVCIQLFQMTIYNKNIDTTV